MKGVAVAAIAVALVACGSEAGSAGGRTLVERVHATPTRRPAAGCAFLISAPLVGGGEQATCITELSGVPGPRVVMHGQGWMTFRLPRGSIRARVRVTQRFGSDGVHAHQTVGGSIVSGTRVYRGAGGRISGGGNVVDRATGLGRADLRYTLHLISD